MSPEFYRVLHIVSLFAWVGSLTLLLLTPKPSKKVSMIAGIASAFVLIAGFGLIAKYQYNSASPWLLGKMGIWAVIAIVAPIIAKRAHSLTRPAFYTVSTLFFLAVTLVVFR